MLLGIATPSAFVYLRFCLSGSDTLPDYWGPPYRGTTTAMTYTHL